MLKDSNGQFYATALLGIMGNLLVTVKLVLVIESTIKYQ